LNPPDEPVFNEPWEAQAFAIAVSLEAKGAFTWPEWAQALGHEIKVQGARSYYECWLAALEKLVEEKRLLSEAERLARIDAWDRAAKATPHGHPIELKRA